jgi:hypothetical protein
MAHGRHIYTCFPWRTMAASETAKADANLNINSDAGQRGRWGAGLPRDAHGPFDHLGYRWSDALDTHDFVYAAVGQRAVFTNSSENITYSGLVGAGGAITDRKKVANRDGESAAVGPNGAVYVANRQIFIYGPDGKETRRIDVPARPLQLIFGGADKRTQFILTHQALYSTRIDGRAPCKAAVDPTWRAVHADRHHGRPAHSDDRQRRPTEIAASRRSQRRVARLRSTCVAIRPSRGCPTDSICSPAMEDA